MALAAPGLQGDLLEVAGRSPRNQLAHLGGAGEGDLVDVGVVGDGGPRRLAEAGQDVDHAFGKAGLEDQLAEAECGERGLLGGLEHDGAAGRECRA